MHKCHQEDDFYFVAHRGPTHLLDQPLSPYEMLLPFIILKMKGLRLVGSRNMT